MAATTMATWYAAFRDLTLRARIPCKWIDLVGMEGAPFMVGVVGGWPTLKCRVIVLMHPMGQDRQATRWSDAVTMVDTLNAAITGMTVPTKGPLSWEITLDPNFSDSGYFAVIATVEGGG